MLTPLHLIQSVKENEWKMYIPQKFKIQAKRKKRKISHKIRAGKPVKNTN